MNDANAVYDKCCPTNNCHVRIIGHSKGGGLAHIHLHEVLEDGGQEFNYRNIVDKKK